MTRGNEIFWSYVFIAFLLPAIIPFIWVLIDYTTYRGQTAWGGFGCKRPYKLALASYAQFKRDFYTVDWIAKPQWDKSLFSKEAYDINYLHASIFKINNVGYILTPIGYLRASFLIRKTCKRLKAAHPEYDLYIRLKP